MRYNLAQSQMEDSGNLTNCRRSYHCGCTWTKIKRMQPGSPEHPAMQPQPCFEAHEVLSIPLSLRCELLEGPVLVWKLRPATRDMS